MVFIFRGIFCPGSLFDICGRIYVKSVVVAVECNIVFALCFIVFERSRPGTMFIHVLIIS